MTRSQLLPLFAAVTAISTAAACGSDEPGGGTGDDVGSGFDAGGDTTVDGQTDVATDAPSDTSPIDTFECAPGQARCAIDGSAAVETCSNDGEWETTECGDGEICFDAVCATPGVCEPNAVDSCVDCLNYRGCNAGGTAEGEFPVPFGTNCQDVGGVAQLVERECLPNESRCVDTDNLEVCNECGTGFTFATNCREDDDTTLCDIDRCVPLCEFIRKQNSYIGCEYWAVDLDNAFVAAGGGQYIDADGKPFAIVISNPNADLTATVTVSMQDREIETIEVAPNELRVLEMHDYSDASDRDGRPLASLQGTEIDIDAFKVESTVPIIAYQFNPLDNEVVYSNDASLLFPTSSLGNDYIVMTRRQTFDELKGSVTVVATQPGATEVTVTLPERTFENPLVTLAGRDRIRDVAIPAMQGGDDYTVRLEQFEVLNIETNRPGADLTGTRVESDRPVAVFGGSEAANSPNDDSCIYRPSFDDWVCESDRSVPCLNASSEPDIRLCSNFITCCADHIEHQLLPMFAWGRTYLAARSAQRGDEADAWRIMAGRDDVTVELIGLPDPGAWPLPDLIPTRGERRVTLDEGEWYEVESPVDFVIEADGPIMVGQFLAAEQAPYPPSIDALKPPHLNAETGDPAFVLAVPVEQFRTDYTFLAPDGFEFDYITVSAPVAAVVELDGRPVDEELWELFDGGVYKVARTRIEDGVHRITSDVGVGVMVHGFDSYVSYGYAAGLDVREISGSPR